MTKNPPSGLIQRPENFFRRKQREVSFYLSTTFRLHVIYFACCAVITAIYMALMVSPFLQRFEYVFLDLFFRQRPPIYQHPAIAYIDMAEDSLQALGRWPWPRHNHAAMLHILHEWKANAVVFDVIFSEPSTNFDDGAMLEALTESDNVYLPLTMEPFGRKQIWIRPLPEFLELTKGTGHVNIFPDQDGTLRRVAPLLENAGETYPYLAVKVAYDYLKKPIPAPDEFPFPTDSKRNIFINWAGDWKHTFQHYSYIDIIRSYAAIQEGKEPVISPAEIKDKICIIGLTAIGLTDIKANPLEASYPAVGVQANVLNSILTNQYIRPASLKENRLALLLVGFLASFLLLFSRQIYSFIAGLGLGLIWIGFAYVIFIKQSVWLYVVNPLLLIFSLFVFSAVFSLTIWRKERERLFTLATRDGLTGLYVIRHFRVLLNGAVEEASKKKTPLSLIIFDLDHFKKINDTYGHVAGDMVLKHLAKTFQEVFQAPGEIAGKEKNIVGRYGGEEFIVTLKECSLIDAAFNYGEQVRKKLEQSELIYEGRNIPITVSLGVSTLHPGEAVPDLMVHRADEALYRAKEEGRNRTCIEKQAA